MINTELPDYQIAMDVIRRLVGDDLDVSKIFYFVHKGDPKAKGRARMTKSGHVYTPIETKNAQAEMSFYFKNTLRGFKFDTPVAISCVFFRPNFQRIDVDNMMKLVMDAGTKANAWVDDCYVASQSSYVEFDQENPRTLVVLSPTKSSLDRSFRFVCSICQKKFDRKGLAALKRPPKFCSASCRSEGYVRDRSDVNCPKCDKKFTREKAGQKYCSSECGNAARLVRKPRKDQRPPSLCQKCGEKVSRREYTFCVNCRAKGRKKGAKNKPKDS